MMKKIIVGLFACSIFLVSLLRTDLFVDPFLTPKALFVQVLIGVLFVISLGVAYANKSDHSQLCINTTDMLITFWILWVISKVLVNPASIFGETYVVTWFSLAALYYILRFHFTIQAPNIPIGFLVAVASVLAIIGILQFGGWTVNDYSSFPISGFALNPGMYAFHLASIFPCALSIVLFSRVNWARYAAVMASLIIVVAIGLTESRTSWISAAISGGLVCVLRLDSRWFFGIFNTFTKRVALASAVIIFIVFTAIQLYQYKKGSADGRLFIWGISWDIIKDHPLLGVGFDQYAVAHNDYQAIYFQQNPHETELGYLAGNVEYAFNEFLQTWAELGLIGFLTFTGIFYLLISHGIRKSLKEMHWPLIAGLGGFVSILVASLFSYPLHDIPTLLNYFFFAAVIASNIEINRFRFKFKTDTFLYKFILILLVFGSCVFIYNRSNYLMAERKWKDSFLELRSGNAKIGIEGYGQLYSVLKQNKYFLFNYAVELDRQGQYARSIELFRETEQRLNDHDLYNFLGAAYEGINDPDQAEKAFLISTYMIPHLIYPKFRLAILYHVTGQTEKAKKMAYVIVNMRPKVSSIEADRMKYVVKTVILEGKELVVE